MPQLTHLRVSSFRNLDSVDIEPSPKINLIYGDNGAGKTSILEAINVLSIGRSFRTRKYKRLINTDTTEFTVFGKAGFDDAVLDLISIGVQRKASGDSVFRVDGANVSSSAKLASTLPSLAIHSSSFDLLEGSAKDRRMFFDWLVFHVKHEFSDVWKQYTKCVKQRNSLLRRDKITYSLVEPWDKEIARLALRIKVFREESFDLYRTAFVEVFKDFNSAGHNISLTYNHGWKSEEIDYTVQLKQNFERDVKVGYTSIGCHKGELKIGIGRIPAVDILSRGQQKLLVCALVVTQAKVLISARNTKPVFLIDDMPSELDANHIHVLSNWVNLLGLQTFITGINLPELSKYWAGDKEERKEYKVFHVKHGEVVKG